MTGISPKRYPKLYQLKSSAPFKLSRTKIELFTGCPRCFFLDRRLGISRPGFPAFTLNNAVDYLLKKEFDKKIFNFDQGFDTYIYRPHKATNAAAITNDFINYIQTLNNGKYFAYLHYMDAHTPYTRNGFNYYFTDNNSNLFKPGDRTGGFKNARELTLQNRLSDSDKRHVVSLYDGQIRFVDENIKRIVEFLEKARGVKFLVLGAHGHGFVGRHLLGSVTERVIREVARRALPVPVLVVPSIKLEEEFGPSTEN